MKYWTIIQVIIYLILFVFGIYFFVTTQWVGPGKYYAGQGLNILGWIAIVAAVTYLIDRVIIKNK